MRVVIDGELREMIRTKVASGLYGDADEVVRDALRMMIERDRFVAMCSHDPFEAGEEGHSGRSGATLFVDRTQ